jgi:hypothetical protein
MFRFAGVYSDGDTPDPIPNSEVKPVSGDGTARAALWKSSTMPALCPLEKSNGRSFFGLDSLAVDWQKQSKHQNK